MHTNAHDLKDSVTTAWRMYIVYIATDYLPVSDELAVVET